MPVAAASLAAAIGTDEDEVDDARADDDDAVPDTREGAVEDEGMDMDLSTSAHSRAAAASSRPSTPSALIMPDERGELRDALSKGIGNALPASFDALALCATVDDGANET